MKTICLLLVLFMSTLFAGTTYKDGTKCNGCDSVVAMYDTVITPIRDTIYSDSMSNEYKDSICNANVMRYYNIWNRDEQVLHMSAKRKNNKCYIGLGYTKYYHETKVNGINNIVSIIGHDTTVIISNESAYVDGNINGLVKNYNDSTSFYIIDGIKININYDDMGERTWYQVEGKGLYKEYPIMLYFGKWDNGKMLLRLKIKYESESWLFIQSYKIKINNKMHLYSPSDIDRDNASGFIWEWSDDAISKNNITMVRALIISNDVKIRYNGRTYYSDAIITDENLSKLKALYKLYKKLGGGW